MGKILIVYASRTNETKSIAQLIAEGIRMSGHKADVKNTVEIKSEKNLKGYDGYIFGSATYHGEMISSMKQILFIAEKAALKNKPGGAFGGYGWSGEAPGRIFETMEHVFGMKMVPAPLMLKASWVEGAFTTAQEYGKSIAAML
jgi:flavorubredoxin